MTTKSRYWLTAVAGALVLDLALTVHTALTWKRVPTGPSVMPAGELLGWFLAVFLLGWAAVIVIGAVRPARARGWVDPTRQTRMAPHKPVNVHRTRP